MSEYKLDRQDRAYCKARELFYHQNLDVLTAEDIKDFNSATFKGSLKRKHVMTNWFSEVSSTTFVIPVSGGGSVTAYYLVSPKEVQNKGAMPLTIFFHGGGWVFGNMDFYSSYLKYYAKKMDTAVLLVDYRLAPTYRFPTAVEDCYDALLWALEGVKYWKVAPDKIFLAGDGFGATLAASVSILLRDRKGIAVSGQILLYPLTDCRLRTQSMETFKDTPVLSQKHLSWYIKNSTREPKDILSPMMSPLLYPDLSRLPDTLVIAAEIDPLYDDARLFSEELKKADTKAKLLIAKGAMHGFLPYKKAKGRVEAETAIWQFMAGRNVENIEFMDKKAFNKFKKNHA
ncbi:MAG: alpha/beta hydrolase [Spirochaetales bacterium]|nr:alpha/beta hydrolase [Candidatus Physcosoma equi]